VLLLRVPPWPQPAGVWASHGGGERQREGVSAGNVRAHGRLRGCHQGSESRWDTMSARSY